jgi:hypothetical protein
MNPSFPGRANHGGDPIGCATCRLRPDLKAAGIATSPNVRYLTRECFLWALFQQIGDDKPELHIVRDGWRDNLSGHVLAQETGLGKGGE